VLAAKWELLGGRGGINEVRRGVMRSLALDPGLVDDELCRLLLAHSEGLRLLPAARSASVYDRVARFALEREARRVRRRGRSLRGTRVEASDLTESFVWVVAALVIHGWLLHAGSLVLESRRVHPRLRTQHAAVLAVEQFLTDAAAESSDLAGKRGWGMLGRVCARALEKVEGAVAERRG
jgi:hypothetical protein